MTVGLAEPETGHRRNGRTEVAVGGALLLCSLLGAAVATAHPGPNPFDRWGFAAFPEVRHSTVLIRITDLGSPAVLIVATVVAVLVALRSDRIRAAACALGPAATAICVEFLIKPVVGRHFEGALSYPSGNVADLAAVATAWAVAVPRWLRLPVSLVGAAATAAMMVAVVGLRWHYPSDTLGGAVLGVAVVLFIDGALHLWLVEERSQTPH